MNQEQKEHVIRVAKVRIVYFTIYCKQKITIIGNQIFANGLSIIPEYRVDYENFVVEVAGEHVLVSDYIATLKAKIPTGNGINIQYAEYVAGFDNVVYVVDGIEFPAKYQPIDNTMLIDNETYKLSSLDRNLILTTLPTKGITSEQAAYINSLIGVKNVMYVIEGVEFEVDSVPGYDDMFLINQTPTKYSGLIYDNFVIRDKTASQVCGLELPPRMEWNPLPDITTYELALCIPYIGVTNPNPNLIDLSLPHFRHFKITDHK